MLASLDGAIGPLAETRIPVTDEGLLRPGLPQGWASALLPQLMHLVFRELPELSAGQAADVVVDTLLNGLGTS